MERNWTNFADYCWDWLRKVFGPDPDVIARAESLDERARRFLEEALELCQSAGMPKEHACDLVDYVFSRPVGVVYQEMGGTMVTLAVFAKALIIDADGAGWDEIHRCYLPEVMEKIRNKQVSKTLRGIGGSPQKGAVEAAQQEGPVGEALPTRP